MYPVICKIGPFTIYSYGLMFAIAALLSIFLFSKDAKKHGLDENLIMDFAFWVLFSGIIGARIFYIFLNPSFFKENPQEIFMLWHGGLVWFGGLIASLICGILYLRFKKIPVIKTLSLLTPYAALGQAIGRLGCFLNGCCFGKPFFWGVYFPVHQMKLFPAQLLSSLNLFLIFFILKYRQKKSFSSGQIIFLYLMLVSIERFFVEFLRGDSPPFIFHLTVFQIISLAIFIFGIYGTILIKSRSRRQ